VNTVLAGIVIVFFGVQGVARLTASPDEQRAAAYHFGVSLSEYRKSSALLIVAGLRLLSQDGALRVALPLVAAVLTAGTLVW
jgi:hypothetical protein